MKSLFFKILFWVVSFATASIAKPTLSFGVLINQSELDTPIKRENHLKELKPWFDTIALRGSLEWPNWVNEKDGHTKIDAVDLLKEIRKEKFRIRGQFIVHPNWDHAPGYAERYKRFKKMLQNAIIHRITDVATDTRGYIETWDVLHESIGVNDIQPIVGIEGVAKWFVQTKAHVPDTPCFLSDFALHKHNKFDLDYRKALLSQYTALKAAGAPIDGIALHLILDDSSCPPDHEFANYLEAFKTLEIPIAINNFTLQLNTPELNAEVLEQYLIACKAYPQVETILFGNVYTREDSPGLFFDQQEHWTQAGSVYQKFHDAK